MKRAITETAKLRSSNSMIRRYVLFVFSISVASSATPTISGASQIMHARQRIEGGISAATSQTGHAAPAQANWPQLGLDSGHSGYNPHETILNPNNVGQLQQAWSFSTGSGNLAGNVVEDNDVLYAATENGKLFALDAGTGAKVWSFAAGGGYSTSGSAVAVDGGHVYTVCNVPSGSQGVCALDAATGVLQWSYAVAGLTTYPETPPVVAGGLVFFGACGAACAYVALNEKNGRLVWSLGQPSGCPVNNGVVPAVYGGLLFATTECSNSAVIALDSRTGQQKWQIPLDSGTIQGMSVAHSVVCIITLVTAGRGGSEVYALTTSSGGLLWTATRDLGATFSAPAFAYGYIYVPFGEGLAKFKQKKLKRTYFDIGGAETSAAVANGVVYTTQTGFPWAVSAVNGYNLWETTGTPSNGFPIVVNGTVYGACQGSHVCAWTLPSRLRGGR